MPENCTIHVFASGPPDDVEAFRRDGCANLAADPDACGLRVVTAEPNAESPRNVAMAEEARAAGKGVLHILFHTRRGEPPPLGFLDPIISRHPACEARVVWTDHRGDEGEETVFRAGAAAETTVHDYGSAYEAAWGQRDEHPAGEEGEGGAGYGDDGVPAVYADPAYESFTTDPREGDVRVTDHGLDRARVAVTLVLLPDAAAAVVFRDAVARRFHNRMLSANWEHATPLPGGNGVAMMFWDGTDSMGIANDALRAPGLHVCDLRPGRRPARLSLDEHTQITLRYRDRLRGDRLPSRDYNNDRYPDIETLADLTPPGAPPEAVEGYTPWRWEVSVTPAGTPRARWVCERAHASAGEEDNRLAEDHPEGAHRADAAKAGSADV